MPLYHHLPKHTFFLSSAALLIPLFSYIVYKSRPQALTNLRKPIPAPGVNDSGQDLEAPYPPDVFPGARDVASPYGKLRVYEWGPEDGRKVLLVHGISVPCLSLGNVAGKLIDKGCRVLLFDLWGRGYSETPIGLPQDSRLFTTALLVAITSSPISWTRFSLVGYSLGGGIAISFTAHFPHLVDTLILIAPAGLIRPYHFGLASRMLYSTGALPETFLEWLIERRLRGGPTSATAATPKDATAPVGEEAPQTDGFDDAVLSTTRPGITVAKVIAWQVQNNKGFIKSFISSIRHGPISAQHEDLRSIHNYITMQDTVSGALPGSISKRISKVLIICGKTDPIIHCHELEEDVMECLGSKNVRIESCDAGHELPITKSGEIVHFISEMWQSSKV